MNMTKISTLLTSIALASAPVFAQAYQIGPNPNPVDNTIDVLSSDAETYNFTNFGTLHVGKNGTLLINTTLPEDITLSNESSGNLIIDSGGSLNGGIPWPHYDWWTGLNNSGTLNNSGKVENFFSIGNSGLLDNHGTLSKIVQIYNSGIINNSFDGYLGTTGDGLVNTGILNNYGRLHLADILNDGTLVNYGLVEDSLIHNRSILTNNNVFHNAPIWNAAGGTINGSGTYIYDEVTAYTGEIINNGSFSQASFMFNQGHVSGSGNFTGEATLGSGATVSPGGPLTFNGDFHSSGTLNIGISGTEPGQYAVLVINGNADFTGGNVSINFSNDFFPSVGDHWNFLVADGITGFDSLNLSFAGVVGKFKGDLTSDSLGGHLLITSAVPEPGTYAMLLAGLGLLGFVAHRRKTITI
ncbi:FxDxF family PEP-CTERM protein [Nitrosomonas sp.]|uniref:FxDxF family PEP-CTERM protein n=1 Tax=Nitrosomonas sp. TaxID=42353 RepID=UPI0025D13628|nr:FxDxF family PEP-CTERM protein [Nitrosomonas sp.]